MLLNFGLGKQIKTLSLCWALGLPWGRSCGVMGLGAVEFWFRETNQNTEFGLGLGLQWGGSCCVMGFGARDNER